MKDFKIKLTDRKEIAENTIAFTFDISKINYSFQAGQYAHFTIPDPVTADKKGHSRPFSIASPPDNKKTLMIAARNGSSVFVNNLMQLPLGSKVFISKASGSLYLNDESTVIVFIAGGIGITPVRSIVEQNINNHSLRKIFLFYSNKTESQTAFLKEFEDRAADNENFKFIPTIEDPENLDWKHESGVIDSAMIRKYLSDLENKIYYVTGPPLMVDSVKNLLRSEGVTEEKIISEKFK